MKRQKRQLNHRSYLALACLLWTALLLTVYALAATQCTSLIVNGKTIDDIAITGDNDGITSNSNSYKITAKTESSSSCGSTSYNQQKRTITFRNDYNGWIKITYTITGGTLSAGTYCTISDSEITLQKGGNFTIEVKTPTQKPSKEETQTCEFKPSAIEFEELTPLINFAAPDEHGTFTVKDATGTSVSVPGSAESSSYTLTAVPTPNNQYTVFRWKFTSNSGTVSYFGIQENTTTYNAQEEGTITCEFMRKGSAMYSVNSVTYPYLDQAITAAGSNKKIIVIADGTVYGSSEQTAFTIPSGVTLVVPYNAAFTDYTTLPGSTGRVAAAQNQSVYRKLTVPSGTTIDVKGVVSLPAQVSSNNSAYTGVLSGPHGQLIMESGSEMNLQNGAKLYCWGYITGKGIINALNGATVYEAFQISDYRGGSATSSLANAKKTFPFSQYYIQNIETTLVLNYGAVENAVCCLYSTSYTSANVTLPFVGKDSKAMFNLTETGSSFTKSYDPTNERATYVVSGNATLSSITINAGAEVNSADFNLPIMENATIHIASGTTTVNQSLCMIPGSELIVDNGAEIEISSGKSVFVYDRDEWVQSTAANRYIYNQVNFRPAYYSPSRSAKWTSAFKEANLVDVKVDVNGTINVSGNLYTTKSGANITSSKATGKIKFVAAPTASTTTYQYQQQNSAYANISATAAQLKNGDGSYTATAGAAAGTTYYYCTACNSSGVWETEHTVGQKSYNVTISWPELAFTYTRSTSHTYTWDGEGKKYEEKTTNSGKWSDPIGIEVLNESSAGAVNAKFHFNAATDLTGWAPTVKFNSEPANADYTVTVTGSGGKESVPVQPVAAPPDDLAANTTIGTITVTITAASQGG